MTGGRWVRRVDQPHRCPTPEAARPGDVWQCDCGRRWTCVPQIIPVRGMVSTRASWLRRRWPWPRLPKHLAADLSVCNELGVDPAEVEQLLNGRAS